MIPLVNVGGDKRRSLRVGAGHDKVLHTHDVVLKTDSNQTVDMFGDGHEYFSGHVPALLRTGRLILNVNTSSTLLDEHFRQLHNGCKTTMARVSISHNGPHVVHVGRLSTLLGGHTATGILLLAIMEKLCHKQVLNLIGHRVRWVVSQVGTRLVRRAGCARALPP